MYCPNCGASIGEDELFCGNCGSSVGPSAAAPLPVGVHKPDEWPAAPARRLHPLAVVGIVLLALVLVGGMATVAIFLLRQSNRPAAPVIVVQPSMTPEPPNAAPSTPTAAATVAQPSLTPRPTTAPPPTRTPTVNADALVPAGWRLILSDSFNSNANGWVTGNEDTDLVNNQLSISGGRYRWEATAHQPFFWDMWLDEPRVSDFYLSVDARQVSGTDDADYGLMFRRSENGTFYRFGVSDIGMYYFVRLVDWNERKLSDWMPTSAVRAGEVNHLAGIGRGTHFACYINGQLVGEFDDAEIPSGIVGLDIGFDTPGAVAVVEYDNFTWVHL